MHALFILAASAALALARKPAPVPKGATGQASEGSTDTGKAPQRPASK